MVEAPRRRRWQPSVRVRVLGAVLALAALGMVFAGLTSHLVQRQRVEAQVNDSIARTIEEFRLLATEGLDPDTGEPFRTASRLIYVGLQRTVPAPNEGMLGYYELDGVRNRWNAPVTVALRLEDDPELLAVLETIDPAAMTATTIRSLTTNVTRYSYVAVPVLGVGETASAAEPGDEADQEPSTDPDAEPGFPDTGVFVVAVDVDAELRPLQSSYRTYLLVGALVLAVVGAVGWAVAGRLLSPLRSLRTTAQRITETDLSDRIEVTGSDDVSDLASTVNAMLDRLEEAFASQRELLDDVSHELRTPLTVLRGHLELLDATDPEDVTATRTLALDEIDRMGRLVDDLATLARVERPDFVMPSPTDLGLLTDDVFDKARTLGPQRWQVVDRADVVVLVDAQRLTQAWLQLAANAAKFAPADSTIRLGSQVDRGMLRAWVRDEGPGVGAEHAERIFARFQRGATQAEGSGLGLAIVAAIAAAHGGSVELDSQPGAGATFTIALPAEVRLDATDALVDEAAR